MSRTTLLLLLAGALAAVLGRLVGKRRRRWRMAAAGAVWLAAGCLLAAGGYSYWYHHRPLPEPVIRALFQGVTYSREVRREPRPVVVHIVTIDLDAPGVGFLVTPADPADGRKLRAATTSQFMNKTGVQVAVNGGPFRPWHAKGPLRYYPHAGDPVDPSGLTVSRGDAYGAMDPSLPALCFSRDNRIAVAEAMAAPYNAVSGFTVILRAGEVPSKLPWYARTLAPRTAAAVDATGRTLMLVVVDGRQPNYSEGMTLPELAELILAHGGREAINLDGGGSSTLVVEGPGGRPQVLNSPCHGRIPPGRERPVATHLGVFAAR